MAGETHHPLKCKAWRRTHPHPVSVNTRTTHTDCDHPFYALFFLRKKALLFNNVVAVVAALLMVFCRMARSFEMILLARFLYGYNVGTFHLINHCVYMRAYSRATSQWYVPSCCDCILH